jgi:hypothetical protein
MFTVGEPIPDRIDAFHVLPDMYVHDPLMKGIGAAAVMIGAAPVPYASNEIGLPLFPEEGGISCSFHVSPRFR